MQRKLFLGSLAAATCCAPLACVAPARAGVDEAAIGREEFESLRDDGQILFDSSFYEHLNEVGAIVAAAVRGRYEYPIRYLIVRGDTANAFSVPGGTIYVNEPLLRLARNRDELAGVLAHEAGHMVLHHVAKEMAEANAVGTGQQIGSILGNIFLGPLGGFAAENALNAAAQAKMASRTRQIEAQADEEGAKILAATNDFNPYGLLWFFNVMTAQYGPGKKNWLTSHPLDQERIDDLRHFMAARPETFGKYKDTNAVDVAYW
jgi:predicted Zn-dependent protease